jgi:hypothetical protein
MRVCIGVVLVCCLVLSCLVSLKMMKKKKKNDRLLLFCTVGPTAVGYWSTGTRTFQFVYYCAFELVASSCLLCRTIKSQQCFWWYESHHSGGVVHPIQCQLEVLEIQKKNNGVRLSSTNQKTSSSFLPHSQHHHQRTTTILTSKTH